MKKCSLCNKKNGPGKGPFFHVPKDERRRKQWSELCRIEFSINDRICIDHFLPSDIIKGAQRSMLMPCAAPFVQITIADEDSPSKHKEKKIPKCSTPKVITLKNETTSSSQPTTNKQPQISDKKVPLKKLPQSSTKISFKKLTQCSGGRVTFAPTIVECVYGKTVDSETQTEPIILECTTQMKNDEYKKTIRKLQMEIKELRLMLMEATTAVNTMRSIFTEGQLRKLMTPQNIQWRWSDISHGIFQHQTGPRAYTHLYKKGYPLPSLSTLQRWCRTFDVNEGILNTAIDFLKHNTELAEEDKICVLAFDEMKIEDSDKTTPKCVQVVIARGLRKSWKQPVFYNYDCEMRKDTLCSIISKLKEEGFPVVGVVWNPINHRLWKEFKVTVDKPWFSNPANTEQKVFVFANAPHLLKLIRNQYLDTGLMCDNVMLKPITLTDLLKYTNSEKRIKCELTDDHFAIEERENVKFAAQLFSKTTANAIKRCHSLGLLLYKPTETAEFIKLVNDWFDVMNSTIETINKPGKEPFGSALASQQKTLESINKLMSTPMIPKSDKLALFQNAVIITNNSLQMLHEYLKEHYMNSILTQRCMSQDVMDDFLSTICIKNVNPTTKEFKHRLRRYILARNTEHLHGCVEVKSATTEGSGTSSDVKSSNSNVEETVLTEEREESEKPHDDIDLNDLIAIQELSGGMFDYILARTAENIESPEKLVETNKVIPTRKRKNNLDTTIVKMDLGNEHMSEELDELDAANLNDWAANFNSSLLETSTTLNSNMHSP